MVPLGNHSQPGLAGFRDIKIMHHQGICLCTHCTPDPLHYHLLADQLFGPLDEHVPKNPWPSADARVRYVNTVAMMADEKFLAMLEPADSRIWVLADDDPRLLADITRLRRRRHGVR